MVLLLRVPEAGEALGLCPNTVRALVRDGELEAVHVGRAVRIPTESVEEFVSRLRSDANEERK